MADESSLNFASELRSNLSPSLVTPQTMTRRSSRPSSSVSEAGSKTSLAAEGRGALGTVAAPAVSARAIAPFAIKRNRTNNRFIGTWFTTLYGNLPTVGDCQSQNQPSFPAKNG